jgi:PDZ domain-containing protein
MADEITVAPPVPPAPRPPVPRRRGRLRTALAVVLSAIGVLVVIALVAGFLIHLPYVVISPGTATPLDNQVVTISGASTYAHRGDVLYLTVRVSNSDPNAWHVLVSWLDPDVDIEDRSDVVGCLTDAENNFVNNKLMQQSQDDAKYVALTRLGNPVTAHAPALTVVEACPGTPAHGKLAVGDQVLAIDDHAVASQDDIASSVRAHHPGDTVVVTVDHSGTRRTVSVVAGHFVGNPNNPKCVPARSGSKGTACLGVASQVFTDYTFPFDVHIDTARVSGPSAGLAFALAIIDDLTPGNLTGGKHVAVTGTIASNGAVGDVGGAEQKAITARRSGATLMIVPSDEVRDARKGAGNMRVVGVHDVAQALDALRRAGGAALPTTTSP